ncbi:MAG: hypothetical protein JOZ76_11185 [Bradyrhizobium sp.]|nr:hypothetical protein [Acidobacteriota bacterium]MBV8918651.1 hypothetical protein [Bradyrhizobium sp.]
MTLGDALGILGLAVALASNVFAYFLYAKTFESKAISSDSRSGMEVTHPEFRTMSSGVRAPLRYSDCVVWNSGRATIFGSDLKSENGIEILFSEAEIFKGPYVQVSLRENKVEVRKHQPGGLSCRFDFLDPGQGFQVSVGYAVPTPDLFNPTFERPKIIGVVVGMPKGITSVYSRGRAIRSFYESYGFAAVLLILFLVANIFSKFELIYALAFGAAITSMAIIGAVALYRAMKGRRPRRLIPLYV